MKTISIFILTFMLALLINSCSKQKENNIENNELAMSPNMIVKAKNASGTITIEAGKGLERIYRWDENKVNVKMRCRDKRWDGSLGIYNPGGGKDIHTVVEEGQQHFYSEEEAVEWLTWQDNRMHYVYSPDGLVVGWYTLKDPNASKIALSVQVWQFYILGKKPVKLPGARKDAVSVTFKDGASAELIQVGSFRPSSPQKINGRWYSGKSVDIMIEKGITTDRVEKCISVGRVEEEQKYLHYYDLTSSKLLWVKLDKNNRVVLVGN